MTLEQFWPIYKILTAGVPLRPASCYRLCYRWHVQDNCLQALLKPCNPYLLSNVLNSLPRGSPTSVPFHIPSSFPATLVLNLYTFYRKGGEHFKANCWVAYCVVCPINYNFALYIYPKNKMTKCTVICKLAKSFLVIRNFRICHLFLNGPVEFISHLNVWIHVFGTGDWHFVYMIISILLPQPRPPHDPILTLCTDLLIFRPSGPFSPGGFTGIYHAL